MNTSGKMMNCDTYKEAIAADPSFADDEGHVANCESCARFRDEMQALDATIARALQIDVPALQMPDLPEIRNDEKVVNLATRRKPRSAIPAWVGIAAGFALAAVVGTQYFASDSISDEALAAEVLAHVDHEPWAMEVTDVAVADARVTEVMSANNGTMNTDIGLVSYAQSCVINGKRIPHLVVQGRNGPITILLMPEEMVSSPVALEGRGISGTIFPLGDGSVAIVGERDVNFDEIRKQVESAVEWRI